MEQADLILKNATSIIDKLPQVAKVHKLVNNDHFVMPTIMDG